jgi:phage gpG-like protein
VITGDFAKLEQLAKQMRGLDSARFRKEAARLVGNAAKRELIAQFREGTDPYQKRWAPLKRGDVEPLIGTEKLLKSYKAKPTPNGFRLQTAVPIAGFHQDGTKKMPRRQMVPEQSTGGVGPLWAVAMNKAMELVLKKWVHG